MESVPQKVCGHCHVAKPATLEHFKLGKKQKDGVRHLGSWCRGCHREAHLAWVEKNRAAHNAKQRANYQAKHPPRTKTCDECQATYPYGSNQFSPGKRFCRACGERRREEAYERARRAARDRRANPTRACSRCGEIKPNTPEYFWRSASFCKPCHLSYTAAWARAHPEYIRAKRHARRAKLLVAGGAHTVKDVQRQFAQQKGRCYWCRGKLATTGDNKFHVDHLIALAKGGTNGPENIVCACPDCNRMKNDRLPWEFAGRLL